MKIKDIIISLLLFAIFINVASASLNVSLADHGSNIRNKTSGSLLSSASLSVEVYDSSSGGNLIYNETFADAIVNGSWNIMLGENLSNPLSVGFGKLYYKDYRINGENVNFTNLTGQNVDRQFFYSPLGDINYSYIQNAPWLLASNWNATNTSYYLASNPDGYITFGQAGNGTLVFNSVLNNGTYVIASVLNNGTYTLMTNTSYYLTSNPFGFYNSTSNIGNWTGDKGSYTLLSVLNNGSYFNAAGGEPLWEANYSTFLTHITFTQAMNGTLAWMSNLSGYLLISNWNATNTSYYLVSNPFGFYNSTSNIGNWTGDKGSYTPLSVLNNGTYVITPVLNNGSYFNGASSEPSWNANYTNLLTACGTDNYAYGIFENGTIKCRPDQTGAGLSYDLNITAEDGSGVITDAEIFNITGNGTANVRTYISGNDLVIEATAGSGEGISGAGTSGRIARFNGTTSVNDSLIFENETNIGIGTTTPQNVLNVIGNINGTRSIFSFNKNLSIGYDLATNGTFYLASNPSSYINWATASNGTLAFNSSLINFYTKADILGFGYYNSTSNIGNWTADKAGYTLLSVLNNGTYLNTDTFVANYSTFLTHITFTQAMNGTLAWMSNLSSYLLISNWNATNTSYYLASNPFGFYNSTSNIGNWTGDKGSYTPLSVLNNGTYVINSVLNNGTYANMAETDSLAYNGTLIDNARLNNGTYVITSVLNNGSYFNGASSEPSWNANYTNMVTGCPAGNYSYGIFVNGTFQCRSDLTGAAAEADPYWTGNVSLFNSSWMNTFNQTVNDSINNYILYVNSTNGAGSGSYNDAWINNTFFNKTDILGFGYYNSTSNIGNWTADKAGYTLLSVLNNGSYFNAAGGEPLWEANYSTFLTHITFTQAMNGTLAWMSNLSSYALLSVLNNGSYFNNFNINDYTLLTTLNNGSYLNPDLTDYITQSQLNNGTYALYSFGSSNFNGQGYFNTSGLVNGSTIYSGGRNLTIAYMLATNGTFYLASNPSSYTTLATVWGTLGNGTMATTSYVDTQNTSQTNYVNLQNGSIINWVSNTFNTTRNNYVASVNASMKNYVDSQDSSYNTSNNNYIATKRGTTNMTFTSTVNVTGGVSASNVSIAQGSFICLNYQCSQWIKANSTGVFIQG